MEIHLLRYCKIRSFRFQEQEQEQEQGDYPLHVSYWAYSKEISQRIPARSKYPHDWPKSSGFAGIHKVSLSEEVVSLKTSLTTGKVPMGGS